MDKKRIIETVIALLITVAIALPAVFFIKKVVDNDKVLKEVVVFLQTATQQQPPQNVSPDVNQ